jgi:hypothetical protein
VKVIPEMRCVHYFNYHEVFLLITDEVANSILEIPIAENKRGMKIKTGQFAEIWKGKYFSSSSSFFNIDWIQDDSCRCCLSYRNGKMVRDEPISFQGGYCFSSKKMV